MCEACGQDIKRKQQDSLVPRSKWHAGKKLEHLERSHAQSNPAHDGNIAGHLRIEMAIGFSVGVLAADTNTPLNGLDERGDVAAQQALQHREKAESSIRCALPRASTCASACAAASRSLHAPEKFERLIE